MLAAVLMTMMKTANGTSYTIKTQELLTRCIRLTVTAILLQIIRLKLTTIIALTSTGLNKNLLSCRKSQEIPQIRKNSSPGPLMEMIYLQTKKQILLIKLPQT
jgi:hypothetical protein